MNLELIIIVATIVLGFTITLLFIRAWTSQKTTHDPSLFQWLSSLQSSIENTNQALNSTLRGTSSDMSRTLQENTRQLNDRLDRASQVIASVQKNLGEMSEVGKGIKSLQEFLQSPKLRGNIGEQILAEMIGENFPKNAFHLQYSFSSGTKADAVLKTDAGLLCIDSKFPMTNFQLMIDGDTDAQRKQAKKDFIFGVKKHIADISQKYILPEEKTLDFALMYIPAESVYYEVVNNSEIMDFAKDSRVYPVSPNTLYAHLQLLLVSFQGKELEAKSQEVLHLLLAIKKDFSKVEENLGVLNRHVTNSYNQMSHVTSGFTSLGQKLSRSSSLIDGRKTNPPQIDS